MAGGGGKRSAPYAPRANSLGTRAASRTAQASVRKDTTRLPARLRAPLVLRDTTRQAPGRGAAPLALRDRAQFQQAPHSVSFVRRACSLQEEQRARVAPVVAMLLKPSRGTVAAFAHRGNSLAFQRWSATRAQVKSFNAFFTLRKYHVKVNSWRLLPFPLSPFAAAGKWNNKSGSPECKLCDLGHSSNPGDIECFECPVGKYQIIGTACQDCDPVRLSSIFMQEGSAMSDPRFSCLSFHFPVGLLQRCHGCLLLQTLRRGGVFVRWSKSMQQLCGGEVSTNVRALLQ